MKCPACTEILAENASRCDCGYRVPKATAAQERSERNEQLVVRARQHYMATALTSYDLTPQQWYNVCRFFPVVAEHCKRTRPQVGPDNPLHATSRMGFFARARTIIPMDREGEAEREAIMGEAA